MTIRICLWSGPRNISTALMYAFGQRPDTTLIDEPLYAHYLSKTAAKHTHPGAAEVIATMENDGETVVRDLILGDCSTPILFCKNMTHHLHQLDRAFLDETVNVILTRDPVDMLPSYVEAVERPTLADVGYKHTVELLETLQERGQNPAVLDSTQLLLNPHSVLAQLCEHIGIPFDERMLAWEAGARPEDGCWAKHWYHSVHKSTGFAPYKPKNAPFPGSLRPLLDECLPYYATLTERAIRPRQVMEMIELLS